MLNIGGGEMIFLAILALLVFGPEGLPDIIKTVTRTVRALRQAASDFQTEVNTALTLETQKREVAHRRRRRRIEPATPSEAEGEGPPPPLPVEEAAEAPAEDLAPTSPPTEPVSPPEGSEESAAGEAPPEDDDGPGLPMTRPTPPPQESESSSLETVS